MLLLSRALSAKSTANTSTVRRQVDTLELQSTVSRKLAEFRRFQRTLMPGLGPVLDEMDDDVTTGEPLKLLLPSDLSLDEQGAWYPPDMPALEFRFRCAQADDSLVELRRLLRLYRNLRDENSKHPGLAQKSVTRTKGLFQSFQTWIDRSAERYSHAHSAMLTLDPDQNLKPDWMGRFKELDGSDVRGPGREQEDTSEGKFKPSWIWLVPLSNNPLPPAVTSSSDHAEATSVDEPTAASDAEVTESMRAHWAKCQARAERYEEEVSLTTEEMGRTLRYFEWKQSQWLSLQSLRQASASPPSTGVQRGLEAYARRQANVYETLIFSFANQGRKSLTSRNLHPPWLSRYPATPDPQEPDTNPKSAPSLSSLPRDDTGGPLKNGMDTGPDNDDIDNSNDDGNDDGNDNDNDDNDYGGDYGDCDEEYVINDAELFEFDLEDEFMD